MNKQMPVDKQDADEIEPEENSKEIFDEMVLAGLKGVQRIMEVEDLQDVLTPEDAKKVGEAIAKGIVNWVEYMKLATRGK